MTATDVRIYGLLASQSCYHSMVSLHCGPVVDFTTLHPFDFDRNLFNFLFVSFFPFSEVQFNWFSFSFADGFFIINNNVLNL